MTSRLGILFVPRIEKDWPDVRPPSIGTSAITGNYGQGIQAFECLAGGPTSDWAPSLAGPQLT
jgi:hypothetical protein